MISGLEECVKNQYAWLWQMCTPDGHAPAISDSYTLDAETDLRRAAALIGRILASTSHAPPGPARWARRAALPSSGRAA